MKATEAATMQALDLALWADLSQSAAIAKRHAGDGDAALAAARVALGCRNVVVQRNAVRLIEAAFAKRAPLKGGHPALAALQAACVDGRPLVMWEAEAASARLQKRKEHDLDAPYPGLVDGRRSGQAIWAWVWGGPGSLSYLRMRVRMHLTPANFRSLLADSGRPERETLEAIVAKQYKPTPGDDGYAADLSKPVFTEAELATSLGKRVYLFHSWAPCNWDIFEGRKFMNLSSRERTVSEDALVWLFESLFWSSTYQFTRTRSGPLRYATPIMGLTPLEGPRGAVINRLRQDIEANDESAIRAALLFTQFVEDPLLLAAVQSALASKSRAVRARALATAAVLGDEDTLARATSAQRTAGPQAIDHVWALGLLGDRRGFELIWKIAEAANTPDAALLAAAMMGEVSDGWEGRIAAVPKWASNDGVLYALCARWAGHEIEGILRIVDLAATHGLDEKVLKRFALTKRQRFSFTYSEKEFKANGFLRDDDGEWRRDPQLPALTPEETDAFNASFEGREMAAANRYFGPTSSPLQYASSVWDWAAALMRHFAKVVGDASLKLEDRALALRRLAIVAGEDAAVRIDQALAKVSKGDAAALRAMVSPQKKGGKAK